MTVVLLLVRLRRGDHLLLESHAGRDENRHGLPAPWGTPGPSAEWATLVVLALRDLRQIRHRCCGARGCVGLGVVLYVIEYFFGRREPAGRPPNAATPRASMEGALTCTSSSPPTVPSSPWPRREHLKSFADPEKITDVSVVAVVRPLRLRRLRRRRSAPSADEPRRDRHLPGRGAERGGRHRRRRVRRAGARRCTRGVCAAARPPTRSSRRPRTLGAGLVSWSPAASRGLSDTVLLGSTAQRVQHYAPCPVLVVRPARASRTPDG